MDDFNKTAKSDVVYAIAKAGLGSIPLVGAAASELLTLIVAPPIESRRNAWLLSIGEKLRQLENEKRLDVAQLQSNEQFIDAVLQATTFAIKTNDLEKVKALQNALINTALGESPDAVKSAIFLNLVNDFTSLHIKILDFVDNPEEWYSTRDRRPPNLMSGGLITLIVDAYPDLKTKSDLVNIIWEDLKRAGFHRSGDLGTMMTSGGLLASRTTEMGREFLKFIRQH